MTPTTLNGENRHASNLLACFIYELDTIYEILRRRTHAGPPKNACHFLGKGANKRMVSVLALMPKREMKCSLRRRSE